MSDAIQKVGFGYVDDTDDSLRSKSGGVFGLNPNSFLSKFEHNANAGKDGTAQDALDIHVMVGEKEFRKRIYEPTRAFDKDGNEIADKTSKEFLEEYNKQWTQSNAVIVHFLKAFLTDEQVKQGLSVAIPDFKTFLTTVTSLLPNGFQSKPIDVFLEYQWKIGTGQDRTYLTLPGNMKGGYFVVAALPGVWKEEIDHEGTLTYKNETAQLHTFKRDKNFMESHKGIQQIEGQEANQAGSAMSPQAGGATGAAPQGSTW